MKSSSLSSSHIIEIFDILASLYKDAKTELNYKNNYTLLVAVVLSAQAKDSMVNIATEELFNIADTPEKMIEIGEEELISHIKIIGLYKAKAKNIISLSKRLVESFNSIVPDNLEDLVSLDGVGRKTANVILNVAFNESTMPVDTHVKRLSNRIGFINTNDLLKIENKLLDIVPNEYGNQAHHFLILHGRYVCKAKGYNCSICKLNKLCLFDNKVFN